MFASGGGERILAIFAPGSLVGELSMIDGAPRSASVAALRPSKLKSRQSRQLRCSRPIQPDFYRLVMTLLARRLRQTNLVLAAASFLPVKAACASWSASRTHLERSWQRAHVGTAKAHPKRPCSNGGTLPGECQPNSEGMDGSRAGEQTRRLLLLRKQGRDRTRRRSLKASLATDRRARP